MTDSVQAMYTAGILAAGSAGAVSADEDEQTTDAALAPIVSTDPVHRDSDGTPVGASDAAADAASS